MNSDNPTPEPLPAERRTKTAANLNWPIFLTALLGPAVLTTLAALVVKTGAIPIGLILSVIGGAVGGFLIVRRIECGVVVKIFLGLIFIPVFILVTLFLCMTGCSIGGGGYRS